MIAQDDVRWPLEEKTSQKHRDSIAFFAWFVYALSEKSEKVGVGAGVRARVLVVRLGKALQDCVIVGVRVRIPEIV